MVLCNQSHCVFFFGYTSPLCIQKLLCGLPLSPDKYEDIFLPFSVQNGRFPCRHYRTMDVGNICAPSSVDGFCSKITFQDIHFIIWDTAVIGMVAIFLCNDGIALNLSFKYSKSCCAIGVNI